MDIEYDKDFIYLFFDEVDEYIELNIWFLLLQGKTKKH